MGRMRSCKEAGTGCLPPRYRTGVSAARLQVAHLDPLRIAGPDPLKLRRWSRPACATAAAGWKATRWSIDRRVQQLIAGQQRPVPGTGPKASRCCPRPPAQPGRRKPISTCRGTVRPGLPGREPRAWVSRPAGRSRAPDIRCTPGHQSFRVFPLSTQYPQNAGSYPHLAAVIHWFIHSPSTGYRM